VSARIFLSLLADSGTIVHTLKRTYGAPRPREGWRDEVSGLRRAVRSVHPARVSTKVVEITPETPDTRTLVLDAAESELPPHLPGQYVNVFVEVDGVFTSRPLSISSVPGEDHLRLTIKRKPGGFVSGYLVDEVRVGDALVISGPEGDFRYLPFRDGQDLVFIAGGSGITPLMPMMEHILQRHPEVRIHLLYGSAEPGQVIFRDRIEALARRHDRLDVTLTVDRADDAWTGQQGLLDRRLINEAMGANGVEGRSFFLCGPPAMERAVRADLQSLGVSRSRVRSEVSGPHGDPTLLPGWPEELSPGDELVLRVEGNDQAVLAEAGEPLLNSLERAGLAVPALCRTGTCGSCRTRLLQGAVVRRGEAGHRPSDERAGYVNACVCYPVSDALIRIPGEAFGRAHEQAPAMPGPAEPASAAAPAQRSRGAATGWLLSAVALGWFALLCYLVVWGVPG